MTKNYLLLLAERGDYALPWMAYLIDHILMIFQG